MASAVCWSGGIRSALESLSVPEPKSVAPLPVAPCGFTLPTISCLVFWSQPWTDISETCCTDLRFTFSFFTPSFIEMGMGLVLGGGPSTSFLSSSLIWRPMRIAYLRKNSASVTLFCRMCCLVPLGASAERPCSWAILLTTVDMSASL